MKKSGIVIILLLFLLVCGCVESVTDEYITSEESFNISVYEYGAKYEMYDYVLNGGDYRTHYTCYKGINDYLSTEEHTYYISDVDEIYMELFENKTNNEYMSGFIDELDNEFDGDELAKVIISLAQNIEYDDNKAYVIENIDPYGDYFYPYETLYRNIGVCSDKSILMAYILKELDYDVVLFDYDIANHMAVGIKTNRRYDYKNTGYAYIESTVPSMITWGSADMGNEIPDIIYLNEGGKGLYNLKEEYNDMKRFNEIDNMPTVIPKDVYNEWVELISKYHIEVSYYLEEEEYNCLKKSIMI